MGGGRLDADALVLLAEYMTSACRIMAGEFDGIDGNGLAEMERHEKEMRAFVISSMIKES